MTARVLAWTTAMSVAAFLAVGAPTVAGWVVGS